MKRFQIFLILMMTFLLMVACGDKGAPDGGEALSPDIGEAPISDSASDGGAATGGDFEISFPPDAADSIAEGVGVTVAGERMVMKYSDSFFANVYKPDGCTSIYQLYLFDPQTGELTDSAMFYGFDDADVYRAAMTKYLDDNSDFWLRYYSNTGRYYGFYTFPAVRDEDNDGVVTWDDALYDLEYWGKDNYILIE